MNPTGTSTEMTSTSNRMVSSDHFSSLSSMSYGGMIEKSFSKRLRNLLFFFFSYVDFLNYNFKAMHVVVCFFRLLQFFGGSLLVASSAFWQHDSIVYKTLSVLSVFWHILPPDYRIEYSWIIILIYNIAFILYYIIILASSYYLKNSGKVSNGIAILSLVFSGIIGYVFQPIVSALSGELIMNMINTLSVRAVDIVNVVLSLLLYMIYVWLTFKVTGVSLLMRPASLGTIQSRTQFYILLFSVVLSVVPGITSRAPYWPQVGLCFANAIFVIITMYFVYRSGCFIKRLEECFFYSTLTSCFVNFIIIGIVQAAGLKGNEILLIVLIVLYIPIYIVWNTILNKIRNKGLEFLDRLVDDNECISELKNPMSFQRIVNIGFQFAHPMCTTWQAFRLACEKWPGDIGILSMFAKFVAIYPEENRTLELLYQQIRSGKKSGLANMTLEQIGSVMRLRESNLAASLKRHLSRVMKYVENSKHKHRRIWDLVIQGNINEMSHTIRMANESVQKCDLEFSHLLSQYPNNRFVARTYARYIKEIKSDQMGFTEWMDKIRLLQRGLQVTADRPHELGLDAYPNLPQNVSTKPSSVSLADSEISVESELDDEAGVSMTMEQTALIQKTIDNLVIPSIRFSNIITFTSIIVFLCIPLIVLLAYSPSFVNSSSEPLNYLYALSLLRSLAFQLSVYEIRYVMEQLPYLDNESNPVEGEKLVPVVDSSDFFPEALGGFNETKSQLEFLLSKVTNAIEDLNSLRAFEKDSAEIDQVRTYVFSNSITYDVYTDPVKSTSYNMSLQDIMVDFSLQVTKILGNENINRSTMLTTEFLNPNNNCESVAQAATRALQTLRNYFSTFDNELQNIILIVEIVVIVFVVIYAAVTMFIEYKMISSNKREVYRCLTALPKNVVSQIVESLRVLKKDNANDLSKSTEMDTELSKQEENILKIFASAGESSNAQIDGQISLLICTTIVVLLGIAIYVVLCNMYSQIGQLLVRNSPHLDFLLGSYGYMMGCFLSYYSIMISLAGYDDVDPDPYYIINRFNQRFSTFQTYYHYSRYGINDTMPYTGFSEGLSYARTIVNCDNEYEPTTVPREIIGCIPITLDIPFIAVSLKTSLFPYEQNKKSFYDMRDEKLNILWYLASSKIYEALFYHMFIDIVPQITNSMTASIPETSIICVVLIILAFLFAFINWMFLKRTENDLKFALGLLLHCPPSVISQTHKIQMTLNGDFHDRSTDTTNRTDEFFTSVVDSLPDGVLCANEKMKIVSTNKAFKRMLEIEQIEPETDLKEFLTETFVDIPNIYEKLVQAAMNENNNNHGNNNNNNLEEKNAQINGKYVSKASNSTIHLILTAIVTSKNVVITIRDESQIVTHNTLIAEERAKSDVLLASILPPSLVRRVQAGETNISFAVQSATITFMDIVEFTPWCASNTAAKVMATLNSLFKEFDALVASHITMTKIKCIGDCYMAAGGIFADVNQPAVHAKEVVDFGLDAIGAVKKINEALNESLRIRVGVNSGGPIVAGVLGVGKPTFEILGPAINMAQQMEHHGVPMQVHISRLVYELIYGDQFVVKERGQIEVKNGKVTTYLVTGKK